jgi:hypothetical protein
MGVSDALACFGIFVGLVSAAATIASLSIEGRERLIQWSHGLILWAALIVATAVLVMFSLREAEPPRWEILLAIFYALAWIWIANKIWLRSAMR